MKTQHKPADPDSGVLEHDISYPARDGYQLRACVFRPVTQTEVPSPLVVYYHGGGWTIGSPEDAAPACRNLVQTLGVVCVAPAYRQGPEDPFPASIDDAWDGLKWIASHAESELSSLNVLLSLSTGFVVGGSSAGGSMAAILTHLARDEGLTAPITGCFLLSPMILPPETFETFPADWKYKDSYLSRTQEACKHDPILTPQLEKIFHDSAAGDFASPMFVPLIWPTGHAGLPRTYFQVCGMDIVRDEDLIYEQVLREENGIETKMDVYPGMPHVFWNVFGMLTQGKKAKRNFEDGMRWLLGRLE
jgi:acetyl esterase/lipase